MIKWIVLCVVACRMVHGETIEEKRAACLSKTQGSEQSAFLFELNKDLRKLRDEMAESYRNAQRAYEQGWEIEPHLEEVKQLRHEIDALEEQWARLSREEADQDEEGYGLWDQEDSTIGQLVMEYGGLDYLYVVPPDLMKQKISLHSGIPIPRQSWSALLEVILEQSGVGIKQLSPLVRQLYAFKSDLMGVKSVLTQRKDLKLYRQGDRVIFVFSPQSEDIKSVFYFFERFRDQKRTYVHQVGNKIAVVSSCEEIEKLMRLYDAVWEEGQQRTSKVIALTKLSPDEMQKILKAYFGVSTDNGRMTTAKGGAHLTILPLEHEAALALIGMKDVVGRAEELIQSTEAQIEDPLEMTVFWYTCVHSDPNDLAEVLKNVYSSLVCTNVEKGPEEPSPKKEKQVDHSRLVNPPMVTSARAKEASDTKTSTNFITSPKTGAIMMVVRKDALPKLQELLKKLDVPKKMVQIEVLIFERRVNSRNHMGLNVLQLGAGAAGKHKAGAVYGNQESPGILDFFINLKKSSHIPALDLGYKFLMSRDDIKINAAPTITTMNQTPATIAVMQEMSIDQGALGDKTKSSYVRQQYGISLAITPTIHERIEDGECAYSITLDTKISFDQPQESNTNQPNVDRSCIENLVEVANGQAWILGGLRSKVSEDSSEKIPFLGEIPGVAKLFGSAKMTDRMRELVIFITPKVITDGREDVRRLRQESLSKRAGDIPEFLERLKKAQDTQKRRFFDQSLHLFFGSDDA